MRLISLCFLLVLSNSEKIIQNLNFPACKNCIHYRPPIYTNDFTSSLSECGYFGKKNVVSDEIKYEYADLCRYDETKCGIEGKYFEDEENIQFKIWKHGLFMNSPTLTLLMIILTPMILTLFRIVIQRR
jgi:hypothetical protein